MKTQPEVKSQQSKVRAPMNSEDRLERALQEMKEENMDAGTLEAARARVWENVRNAGSFTCAEFRQDFRAYLGNGLGDNRRILVEDHLSRCPGCRTKIAEMKGERPIVVMPVRSSSRWVQRGALAAAAAVLLGVLYLGRDVIDGMMAPSGVRATVVSADGGLYRLAALSAEARSAKAEGSLEAGAAIGEREAVRTGPGAHAVLRLADGSMVDVNERTELFVTAAWSGQAIHLQRGDIIVKAAKQRRGQLRVLTRDSIASVKGTVFAVSAGMGGSVVSVVEGSVAVNQPGIDVVLSPGEQAASIPALSSSVAQAVSWSPEADDYLQLLGSLVKIERGLANFPAELRTNSALLSYLPAGALVYGTIPNLGATIGRALSLAEEQAAQNATFGAWWNSETGRLLRQMTDRVQSVNPLLGEEIVFCASVPGPSGSNEPVPMVMARVQPGKRAELASAMQGLFAEAGESVASYSVSDDLMVVSNSPSNLTWALAHLGQGAGSPFAAAIGERYRRGVGWLIAMDAPPVVTMASGDDAPPIELAGMIGMKYLFLEQRAPAGAEENEVTLAFQGARTGMGSWLADAGSGGAAEYIPADALLAGYVSTREPLQLFEELTAQITRSEPDFERGLAEMDAKLGAGFIQNLTAALGTEAAFAVTGLSTSGPTWVMAGVANNPSVIDSSLQKLVETFNAELGPDEQGKRIVFEQQSAGGRTWSMMKPGGLPLGITWTYDRGYMVASSDRGGAERAIATRNGGSPLVWSPVFLGQLPSSAGLHPSAFAWLNAKGALGILSSLAPNPALGELVAGSDPILVVFDGTPEQIHAASRTRITGLIMDAMLIESLGRATLGQQSAAVPRH
jgi:ferric-dicitrate binding protein FerR (iron transport regulator)